MGKADEIINGELRVSPRHITTLEAGEIFVFGSNAQGMHLGGCLLYTSPSPRDKSRSRMPSSA